MSEKDQLRRRLSSLGGKNRPAVRRESEGDNLDSSRPLGGIELTTPFGEAYRLEKQFPPDYMHGGKTLSEMLEFPPRLAAEVAPDSALANLDFKKLIFIDTETTGLVGGAGTIAFLVGIGFFSEEGFWVRQYFMRSPGEEPGMLHALQEDLETGAGFVSFNGRAFDLPLLEMRYRMGLRRKWKLVEYPQMDLLYPARRLWRKELPNCSLNTIERGILQLTRTEKDVPGELIPGIYADFLRTGDTSEIERVIYHNEIDILSMVSLMTEILHRHRIENMNQLSSAEAVGIGRWHQVSGRAREAEEAFQSAASGERTADRIEALRHLTAGQKRAGRRGEAVAGWEQWHALAPDDPGPCIELSMYYEWYRKELETAREWANEALLCLSHWPGDWRRDRLWAEIEHRIRRIDRKIEKGGKVE